MSVHAPAVETTAPFPLELPRQSWLHHRTALAHAWADYAADLTAWQGSEHLADALDLEWDDLISEVELLGHTRPHHLAGSRLRLQGLMDHAKQVGWSPEVQLLAAGAIRKLNDDHRQLASVDDCGWCHRHMTPDQWASIPFRFGPHARGR